MISRHNKNSLRFIPLDDTAVKCQSRILIVDDEPDITFIFRQVLEDLGSIEVDTFNDPLLALLNCKADAYDLLLLDIKMPDMNGFDLFQEIRKIDNKVKVCFITASELSPENLKVFLTLNARVIRKPIGIDDLVKYVGDELESP
jgi:DNA-binding response OmpR family regulator